MIQVNMHEAKIRLSELVKVAQSGGDVVIANRGEPVVRLVPMRKRNIGRAPVVGEAKAVVAWLRANPAVEYAGRSATEMDIDIAAERDAWD
jgi:prevent-host-death family protein